MNIGENMGNFVGKCPIDYTICKTTQPRLLLLILHANKSEILPFCVKYF